MRDDYPQRIVCMTEETTEMLYLLGEDRRIVGISGFTVRPPRARKEKTKVSAFTSADIDAIVELQPDLVLGFSDLQADIAADLIRHGLSVHIFNHRSVKEIHRMILILGGMVGCHDKAQAWVSQSEARIKAIKAETDRRIGRPKVYFEEWDDPIITGIKWVSEIIEIAGGDLCFPELANEGLGKNRIVEDPMLVVERCPDIVLASWCGKKFQPERLMRRPGWEKIPAVRHRQVFEIDSAVILQPGPAALTEGLDQIKAIIDRWAQANHD